METLLTLALVTGVIAMTPVLIWALQGLKPKNGSGAMGAVMDGFAASFEPRQEHLQNAKRHKKQGGSENGDPPSLEG